jgi:FtsP/CotA-like multicopper oxidase with cupredoxin domain
MFHVPSYTPDSLMIWRTPLNMSRLALCMLALGSLLQATWAIPPVRGKPPTDSNINCGNTVTKTLDITWKVGNPNGHARPMTFVNGQFPGPDLVFDENDWVEVSHSCFLSFFYFSVREWLHSDIDER